MILFFFKSIPIPSSFHIIFYDYITILYLDTYLVDKVPVVWSEKLPKILIYITFLKRKILENMNIMNWMQNVQFIDLLRHHSPEINSLL